MTPQEVCRVSGEFFMEPYTMLGIWIESCGQSEGDMELMSKAESCFERNPMYASRCITYADQPQLFLVFYRIMENDYTGRMVRMLRELQKTVSRELDVSMWVCIGKEVSGPEPFLDLVQEIRGKICLRHLCGENAVVDLAALSGREEKLLACSEAYRRLAEALYTADEKNAAEEKEKLFAGFEQRELPEMEQEALAVILAVGVRFSMDNSRFRDVFGQNCPIRRS